MIALVSWITFCVIAGFVGYRHEKRLWNNGIAPSGLPWIQFDTDSWGDRGYTDGGDCCCWISWSGIDAHYKHTPVGG